MWWVEELYVETAEYSVCDGWPNGDVGGRKLPRLARGSWRSRGLYSELGTEDADEQSRQACTAPGYAIVLEI